MSAILQATRPASVNRRRRVRQKVHAPAYASFSGISKSEMLDLYEILDISEVGVAVQCATPMKIDRQVELSLDLTEAGEPISATARVVWSDPDGRVGLSLAALTNSDRHRLQEWLFLNAMAAAANAASSPAVPSPSPEHSALRPSYTDTLTATSAVQREVESLGADLQAILGLVASRSQSLLRASGAAVALSAKEPATDAGTDAKTMICRASAGPSAPPVGATLQVGSGFSGECVRSGRLLRSDDTETDERVDRESCRSLGIRSILAAPIRLGQRVIGLLEVFSAQPHAFGENDSAVLQRFADMILAAVVRTARTHDSSALPTASAKPSPAPPRNVLFVREPAAKAQEIEKEEEKEKEKDASVDTDKVGGIRLPRVHLYLLICAAAFVFLALGYILAPWIQEKLNSHDRGVSTVLASSQPPAAIPSVPPIETATLDQLRQLAVSGDSAAQYALGLRYASGNGVKHDDKEAAAWFSKAAENGNVKAQAALGTRYFAGNRGLPASLSQAYFWTVLARAAGDESSKNFATILASHMSRAQAAEIEQKAEVWYEQHESHAKPAPGR